MLNKTTGKCLFVLLYNMMPNYPVDLFAVDSSSNRTPPPWASNYQQLFDQAMHFIKLSNAKYKSDVDKHKRAKIFAKRDLVLVHLNKHRMPHGMHHKLQKKKFGTYFILKKLGDNVYVNDLPLEFNISSTFNVFDLFEYHPLDATVTQLSYLRSNLLQDEGIDAGAISHD